jgi:carbamoyltransferase
MGKLPSFDRAILGVNYSGYHDSAIALVAPSGETLFACSLERVSRVKQDGRPPHVLLEGMPWEKIIAVAVSTEEKYAPPSDPSSVIHPAPLPRHRKLDLSHKEPFHEFFAKLPPKKEYVCHQMSHAAAAYYLSGFEDALCLVYDGGMNNCPWFGGLYRAAGKSIEPLDRFAPSHYAKITSLYSAVTSLLGFTPNKHEGKITGLAAYGKPTERCRKLLGELFGPEYFEMERLMEWVGAYSDQEPPCFIVNQTQREKLMRPFQAAGITREEMAATVQAMAEEHVIELLRRAREKGWTSDSICLAGGLFANVKINQRVKEFGFQRVFVCPPMTDDGTALGAALAVAARQPGFAPRPCPNVFLGYRYTANEVEAALKEAGIVYQKVPNPAETIAAELAGGSVIGVFQGAMEFGPRALGNRSLLSQANHASINKDLNAKLCRTEFMPFAPMTRKEDTEKCYTTLAGCEHTAEFMTITSDCTAAMREKSPAVVHVDGTARPQLLTREQHPLIYETLSLYHKKTGLHSILNTSFNIHEEPIVCSLRDAIAGFLESAIDVLYMEGGYVARFAENHEAALRHFQQLRGHGSQKEGRLSAVTMYLHMRCSELENQINSLHKTCEERRGLIELLDAKLRRAEALIGKFKWLLRWFE